MTSFDFKGVLLLVTFLSVHPGGEGGRTIVVFDSRSRVAGSLSKTLCSLLSTETSPDVTKSVTVDLNLKYQLNQTIVRTGIQ